MISIDKNVIQKLDRPGPRYTSYPTAPEWKDTVSDEDYRETLRLFGNNDKTLSLYVHLPFCESLCYFCGCNMAVRKPDEKYADEYLDYLEKEIALVSKSIGRKKTVRQFHWGGGTPSFLTSAQMERLFAISQVHFDIDQTGEIAVEVDPRRVTREKVATLRRLGFNRISIGLQDFDEKVQEHVNRIQPYSLVSDFTRWCRELGFASVNHDLIYGLPYQTRESFRSTVKQVIGLKPDRIALYSFAYVPWLKKHQQKLDESRLPSQDEKLDIFLDARKSLIEAGYDAIAMDHFARQEDELARSYRQGQLFRNFMGYTLKPADEFIGLGVSSIGFLEESFFQNVKTLPEYYRSLAENRLPVERGKRLTEDDRIRRWTIQSLMCRFQVDKREFFEIFAKRFDDYFEEEKGHIQQCEADGLIQDSPECVAVTELGRLFVRNICMGFDWYLRQAGSHQRFSRTV